MKRISADRLCAKSKELDIQIISEVLAGDKACFEVLMRKYNNRLFRIARGITRQDSEAMDIVQESWVIIYQSLASFRGPKGFNSWISRITHNNALMRLRKQARISYQEGLEMIDTDSTVTGFESTHPEHELEQQQLRSLLERAIEHLPLAYRSVFIMREVEQLDTRETAESLGLSIDAVKQRFSRGKRLLRIEIDEQIKQYGMTVFEFAGERCNSIVEEVFSRIMKEHSCD